MPASSIFLPALRQAVSGRVKRALISRWRRYVLLARSCDADLEDHQSVFRTLWPVHRSWSLALPSSERRCLMNRVVWRRQLGFTTSPDFFFDTPLISLLVTCGRRRAHSVVRRANS